MSQKVSQDFLVRGVRRAGETFSQQPTREPQDPF